MQNFIWEMRFTAVMKKMIKAVNIMFLIGGSGMTENEAIERLECMRLFMQINDKASESKFLEEDYIANKMAIKALEEVQQYRAIGTVEECRKAMRKPPAKKVNNRKLLRDFNIGTRFGEKGLRE